MSICSFFMKKTFFLTMLMMSFLVVLASSAFADDGDDGDEGNVINIEYIGYGQSHSRSQVEVPIQASYIFHCAAHLRP